MTSFFLSLRESLEIALQILFLLNILSKYKRRIYLTSYIFMLAGAGLAIYSFPPNDYVSKVIISFTFLFYIFSLLLSLTNLSELAIIYVLTLFYLPNSLQLTSVVMDMAFISGPSIYIYCTSAVLVTILIFYLANKFILGKIRLHEFMNLKEMLLFLTTFNIILGGNNKFSDTSMIPFLQVQLKGFVSALLVFLRELLLLPAPESFDSSLKTLFDFLASPRFSMSVIVILILIPPLYHLLILLTSPEPEMDGLGKRSIIRKKIAGYRSKLLKRGTPTIFSFIAFVILIHGANLVLNPVYDPQPVAITSDDGIIKIPLIDSSGDVSDQRLRKYTFMKDGISYRILMIMRPDGEVVAALDACEICPPRGYVQKGQYLVCMYCNTPIPSESLCLPGGCNPIPLPYNIKDDSLILDVIDVAEVSKKAGSKFIGRH